MPGDAGEQSSRGQRGLSIPHTTPGQVRWQAHPLFGRCPGVDGEEPAAAGGWQGARQAVGLYPYFGKARTGCGPGREGAESCLI